jgi:membrane protein required for colicin V production
MAFTAFDIIILLLVCGTALLGVFRGFVTEILSLMAWVAAVIVLRLFFTPASALLGSLTGTATGGAILAFVLVFVVTFFAFRWVAREFGKRTRASVIGPIDRALGFGFGAAKGLIVASLIFLLINLFFDLVWGAAEPKPDWLRTSRTYPVLMVSSKAVADYIDERRTPPAEAKPDAAAYGAPDREAMDQLFDKTGG